MGTGNFLLTRKTCFLDVLEHGEHYGIDFRNTKIFNFFESHQSDPKGGPLGVEKGGTSQTWCTEGVLPLCVLRHVEHYGIEPIIDQNW